MTFNEFKTRNKQAKQIKALSITIQMANLVSGHIIYMIKGNIVTTNIAQLANDVNAGFLHIRNPYILKDFFDDETTDGVYPEYFKKKRKFW